jgi:serine/threonine protein phosphatase PrpC
MNIQFSQVTAAAGRAINQDALAGHWSDPGQWGYWVVADGLGGHRGGEIAARCACEAIARHIEAHPEGIPDRVESAVVAAHQAILAAQEATPELATMRSTVVAMGIQDGLARWAHCGDSRLYAFRHTDLREQTLDDSVPQALVRLGELAPTAIRHHEDRNRLTRCLGSPGPFRCTLSAPWLLQPDDAFLLCSDGFWEFVFEPEMYVDLAKADSCADWLERMVARLRPRAPADTDNYTALAVWVEQV